MLSILIESVAGKCSQLKDCVVSVSVTSYFHTVWCEGGKQQQPMFKLLAVYGFQLENLNRIHIFTCPQPLKKGKLNWKNKTLSCQRRREKNGRFIIYVPVNDYALCISMLHSIQVHFLPYERSGHKTENNVFLDLKFFEDSDVKMNIAEL